MKPMKLRTLGVALAVASAGAFAQSQQAPQQIQSGSGIGTGGSASINTPPPPPPAPPSTGTSGDAAGTQGTSPRTETSVGTRGLTQDNAGRSSGRCDSLIGDERAKCQRDQASTGTTGPGSTGMGR